MRRNFFGPRLTRRERLKRRLVPTVLATGASLLIGIPAGMGSLGALSSLTGASAPAETTPARGVEASESHSSTVRFRREVFKGRKKPVRPEPTPEPAAAEAQETLETTAAAQVGSIEETIASAATEFGLDPNYLIGVAACESGLDPSAYNEAGYHGLFQFDEQTWGAYGYGSIWDPSAQARTTARLIAAGEASRWPNCA